MELTNAQKERLDLLQEECAEIIQAVSKIKRFGFEGKHPRKPEGQTNKEHLEAEIGGLAVVLELLLDAKDVSEDKCSEAVEYKQKTIRNFTKYQEEYVG